MTEKKPTPADMPTRKPEDKPDFTPAEPKEDETSKADTAKDSRPEGREEVPMIAMVVNGEVQHGPMPVEDWAAYEKENKL